MGRASRDCSIMSDTPGPGSYDPEIVKFKTSKRVK